MSETVLSKGWVAQLSNPISRDQYDDSYQEVLEEFYENNDFILGINYEGTLIYSDIKRKSGGRGSYDFYGIWISGQKTRDVSIVTKADFISACQSVNLDLYADTIKEYTSIWYNGSDAYIDDLKLEEFNNY